MWKKVEKLIYLISTPDGLGTFNQSGEILKLANLKSPVELIWIFLVIFKVPKRYLPSACEVETINITL